MNAHTLALPLLGACILLAGCGRDDSELPAGPTGTADSLDATERFLIRLERHCGEAFRGRVVADQRPLNDEDDPFAGRELVMHVRECDGERIRIPFHVGDDRSRTWVLTRTDYGIRFVHDQRRPDGSPEEPNLYGGDAQAGAGTSGRQEFAADGPTVAMYRERGLDDEVTNVWAMEIEPGERFVYALSRPDGRLFQVEFDLDSPVAEPPPPWGHDVELQVDGDDEEEEELVGPQRVGM